MDSDWPPGPPLHQRSGRALQRILSHFWRWIERHDGLLGSIATIILAALTASLVLDSAGQLQSIQGLVREMQASRRPWIPANATVLLPLS
jgi:hypothetical protein